jgi:hypothetical protein
MGYRRSKELMRIWAEYDQKQGGTPYWDCITAPQLNLEKRLIELLKGYTILWPGNEFIMYPSDACRLIDELGELGIAVPYIGVWCSVPFGKDKDECCPEGMGGPSSGGEWFREYLHFNYNVPGFESLPRDTDLAKHCNHLAREYIEKCLPLERGFNDRIRVTPNLYIPLMWNLFPDPPRKYRGMKHLISLLLKQWRS